MKLNSNNRNHPIKLYNIENYNTVIYTITNIEDGMFYIGSSISYKNRWSHHLNLLNKNKHHNIHLQRAWNKYGNEKFRFDILLSLQNNGKIHEIEQKYLNLYFNICPKNLYNSAKIVGVQNGPDISGEKNPKSKLSYVDVKNIREKFLNLNGSIGNRYNKLSLMYNVSPLTISRIIRNKSWNYI